MESHKISRLLPLDIEIDPNSNGLPAGKTGVELWRFDHAVGSWAMFGVGTVTADGATSTNAGPDSATNVVAVPAQR